MQSRLLVWEELMVEQFFAKPLMCVNEQGLPGIFTGGAPSYTHLTKLIENTLSPLALKVFQIDRTPPVPMPISIIGIIITKDTNDIVL